MQEARKIPRVYARVKGGPTQELWRAIHSEGPKPVSNFEDHAGPLTEMVIVGNLAVRLGKKIGWDSENLGVRDLPEGQAMLKRNYRAGRKPKLV
jgi:hypothetical protein